MTSRASMLFTLLLFGGFLGTHGSRASAIAPTNLRSESEANKRALFEYLWPVLKSAGKTARLYYVAACQAEDNRLVAFPTIHLQRPSKNKIGLAAVREIFSNNRGVSTTEQKRGIITIWIGPVPTTVLQTRISILSFDPMAQYNVTNAINTIEHSEEVQSVMIKLGLSVPTLLSDEILVKPDQRLPHLPSSMTNVTMDQALDSVATTFGGIVLYGACNKPGFYRIDFAGGYDFK